MSGVRHRAEVVARQALLAAAIGTRPAAITYEPLAVSDEADVVLIRLTARSLMALQLPDGGALDSRPG